MHPFARLLFRVGRVVPCRMLMASNCESTKSRTYYTEILNDRKAVNCNFMTFQENSTLFLKLLLNAICRLSYNVVEEKSS